jgi:hypothetical protein
MGKDLGTYHVRVELSNGRGFISKWSTGLGFCRGSNGFSPIDAERIVPPWEDSQDVIDSIVFYYVDGNGGCNLSLFLQDAYPSEDIEDDDDDGNLTVTALTIIDPAGVETPIPPDRLISMFSLSAAQTPR